VASAISRAPFSGDANNLCSYLKRPPLCRANWKQFQSRINQRENRSAVSHAENIFHVMRKNHFHFGVSIFNSINLMPIFLRRLLRYFLKNCFPDFFVHDFSPEYAF